MLLGFRLTIPCFLGQSFSMEKLQYPGFDHPQIKVSKENPVCFFIYNKSILSDVLGTYNITYIEDDGSFPYGFEFANYAINPKISYDLIKDKIQDETFCWVQQLWTGDDQCPIVNLIHHIKKVPYDDPMIEEIHYNPIDTTLPLTLSNESKTYFNINSFSFEDLKLCFEEQANEHRDMLNEVLIEDGLDTLNFDTFKGKSSLTCSHPDFDSFMFSLYSSMFFKTFLSTIWLSVNQYNQNIIDFKNTMLEPAYSLDKKEEYIRKHIPDNLKSYASQFDMFVSTTMHWSSNFPKDMVGISTNKISNCFYVNIGGTDDHDQTFSFNKTNYDNVKLLDLLLKHGDVVTYEFIKELEDLSDDFY